MALIGCGGATGPGGIGTVDFSFVDPAADTATATTNPLNVRGTDLLSVSGQRTEDGLSLTLTFAEAITPWSAGGFDALDGFIHLDVDQATGTGFSNEAHRLGVDYYVDLRDDGFGRVALVDVAKRSFTKIPATFSGTSFTTTIRLASLVVTTDTSTALALAVILNGRGRTPVVDSAPNDTSYVIPARAP